MTSVAKRGATKEWLSLRAQQNRVRVGVCGTSSFVKSLIVDNNVRDGTPLEEQVSASNPGFKPQNPMKPVDLYRVLCGSNLPTLQDSYAPFLWRAGLSVQSAII